MKGAMDSSRWEEERSSEAVSECCGKAAEKNGNN